MEELGSKKAYLNGQLTVGDEMEDILKVLGGGDLS